MKAVNYSSPFYLCCTNITLTMNFIDAIIIAIVEGLTEFLPVSSTGHMIITEKVLRVADNDFTKLFTVGIQLGAILAVVVLYWKKFIDFKSWNFFQYKITTASIAPSCMPTVNSLVKSLSATRKTFSVMII